MMANITRNVPSTGRRREELRFRGQLLRHRLTGVVAIAEDRRRAPSRSVTENDSQISGNWNVVPVNTEPHGITCE